MNEIINKFLLAGDNIMPKMHLRQPGFTHTACGPFTNKERIWKFKESGDLPYIHQNEPDKACFKHGITDADFKILSRRTGLIKYCMIKHLILQII